MTPTHSKKRKASELEGRSTTNGHAKKSKAKKTNRKDVMLESLNEPPFKVQCPPKNDPGFERAPSQFEPVQGFNFDYAVKSLKPGVVWDKIRRYKHVKLAEMAVTVGDTVYVLHTQSAKDLPSDATEEEILAFDKKHCWVGKVLEARAISDRDVYILVAWLYWPSEVPVKTHPHFYSKDYAPNELIMSNHLDIIDANTISAKADAYQVDEDNEEHLYNVPDRFWRQTFNAGEAEHKPKDPTILSALKSVCRCNRPINPAKKVLRCGKSSCKAWNHEQCIIDAIGNELWPSYEAGKMDDFTSDNAPVIADKSDVIAEAAERVKSILEDGIAAVAQETATKLAPSTATDAETVTPQASSAAQAKRGRSKKVPDIWKASLDIAIIFDNNQPPVARVTETFGKKRAWDIRVDCLVCGHTMD